MRGVHAGQLRGVPGVPRGRRVHEARAPDLRREEVPHEGRPQEDDGVDVRTNKLGAF